MLVLVDSCIGGKYEHPEKEEKEEKIAYDEEGM
jgi:hypothetical protein